MDRERIGYELPRTIEELSCAQVKQYQDSEVAVAVTHKLLRKTKILFEHYFSIKDVNQAYFLEELEKIFEGKTNTCVFDLLTTKIPEWGNKTGFAILEGIVRDEKLIATEEDRELNKRKAESLKVGGEPKKRGRRKAVEAVSLGNGNGKEEKEFSLPSDIPAIISVVDERFTNFLSRIRTEDAKRYEKARVEVLNLIGKIPPDYLESNLDRLSYNMDVFLKKFLKGRTGRSFEEEMKTSQMYSDFCAYLTGFQRLPYRRNDTF